jgi:hypothetical protein
MEKFFMKDMKNIFSGDEDTSVKQEEKAELGA